MPLTTPSCWNPPLIQRGSDFSKGACASRLNFSDGRDQSGRVTVGSSSLSFSTFSDCVGIGMGTKFYSLPFERCQRILRALANELPLLLGNRCVDVKHERINIVPEFGNDESDTVLHESRDELDITAQTIEL
jgi:hypothetical protein